MKRIITGIIPKFIHRTGIRADFRGPANGRRGRGSFAANSQTEIYLYRSVPHLFKCELITRVSYRIMQRTVLIE